MVDLGLAGHSIFKFSEANVKKNPQNNGNLNKHVLILPICYTKCLYKESQENFDNKYLVQ